VIIIAPQGTSPKTQVEAVAKHFGCSVIVDDWNGSDNLRPGSLALTNMAIDQLVPIAGAMTR
jgi:hypothetical protein